MLKLSLSLLISLHPIPSSNLRMEITSENGVSDEDVEKIRVTEFQLVKYIGLSDQNSHEENAQLLKEAATFVQYFGPGATNTLIRENEPKEALRTMMKALYYECRNDLATLR